MEIGKKGISIIIIGTVLIAAAAALLIFANAYRHSTAERHSAALPAAAQSEAFDLVMRMGVGWNLGNALDSIDNRRRGIEGSLRDNIPAVIFYETYWGNPVTTRAVIDSVARKGFGAVRIPVTWTDHLDDDFNIRPEWLDRVEQVVNYVLDAGMYCIINLHHDTGSGSWPWLRADPDNIEWMEEKLSRVWAQIAVHFKDYGHRLLFESFNEILDVYSNWGGAGREAYGAVNRLNQAFVDTVRGTGGNNAERFLVVKTYAAGVAADILEAFVLPEDSAEGRLLVGVHYYGVLPFSWRQENVHWEPAYSDWDYIRDGRPVEEIMGRLWVRFIYEGIPVIIGEFGAQNKNNTRDRINFAVHYVAAAARYGITCFWWDDGGGAADAESVTSYALLDRFSNEWFFPELAEALVRAAG